jgi:serine protease DegQ
MNTVTRRTRPRPQFRTAAGAALLTASLALTACTGSTPPPEPSGTSTSGPTATAESTAAPAPAPAAEGDIPQLVENLAPSVVTIFTDGGLGSGVVYSEGGLVLTNEHVVRGNTRVEVAFADGQRVEGTVKATDPVTDLALVQANRTGLPKPVYRRHHLRAAPVHSGFGLQQPVPG